MQRCFLIKIYDTFKSVIGKGSCGLSWILLAQNYRRLTKIFQDSQAHEEQHRYLRDSHRWPTGLSLE